MLFKRKQEFKPVEFVPVELAFEPQIGIVPNRDISGWVDRKKKIKWSLSNGRKYYIDRTKAREFFAKGYITVVDGSIGDISEDEQAEYRASTTVIKMGSANG